MNSLIASVPFVDLALPKGCAEHEEILSAISSVLETGQFICGSQTTAFEKKLAAFCGCAHAIGLNSGTDALFFALKILGVSAGDEVIIPANVFWAVASSVVNCGATPVFADVETHDMLISARTIAPRITAKTKAIICVHLTGMPCQMNAINEIASPRGIFVIEDAAQALGAVYHGRKAGSIGLIGCFSFHPLKNIGCIGDGGAMVTDNTDIYQQCLQLRNHGLDGTASQQMVGYNSRLDEIQAAILLTRLARIDAIIAAKRKIADIYKKEISSVCEIVEEGDGRQGVYQLFMVQCKNRDELQKYLSDNDVQTAIHYTQYQHQQKPYRNYDCSHLDVTERLSNTILSLPIRVNMTPKEVIHICRLINLFYE